MQKAKMQNTRGLYFPDRITDAMDEIMDYPLTIVEAPMGYGKTTAVRECLKRTAATVVWQRVHDSSMNVFWTGFCGLFREFNVECSDSLLQLGFPNDSVSRKEALNIIGAIEFPKKTVLVIDDYHIVESTEINVFIEYLVRNEIPELSIVLTLRYMDFEKLDELKLKNYLKHITQQTFEFEAKEIKAYYKMCGINLKDVEVEKLYSITEGWISALYLMMLNFIDEGSFSSSSNINKLVEKALYIPLSDEIKEFLQTVCLFDSFTLGQAVHMCREVSADKLLLEITGKNTLIQYDEKTMTYQIHNIFTKLLKEKFESKQEEEKKETYGRAAQWHLKSGDYFTAMHYCYLSGDFESLLSIIEVDKGHCFYNENKAIFIQYLEECPGSIKERHPIALLIYAINLFLFNEFERFENACSEFMADMQSNDRLDEESRNVLLGEFELLLTFTGYNDILKMLEHIQKAGALLKQPAKFIDTKEGWTFGAPSVLYMFHRESGKLENEVFVLKEALPFYSQITNGHGKGGELVMEAEWNFNRGDIQNAEIIAHKALLEAARSDQYDIIICVRFLQVRIALFKGDYSYIRMISRKLHDDMVQKKKYAFMHTIDLCYAFVYAGLKRNKTIPQWIENGDFESSRLFFPAMAFMNIVYGRVLLAKGDYSKLLGNADQFMGIASVFPNLLGQIYTNIYIASASHKIHRHEDALAALQSALDIAMPDKLYMPFVENGEYLSSSLDELYLQGLYRDDIAKIRELYASYRKSIEKITTESFTAEMPTLTEREHEIARLAAEGFSNREIGESLFITVNTVKTTLKRIFEKLEINSREMLKQYFEEYA